MDDDDDNSDSSNDIATTNVNKINASAVEITNDDSMFKSVSSKDTIKRRMKKKNKNEDNIITTTMDNTKNQHNQNDFNRDPNQQMLNYGLLTSSHHTGSYGNSGLTLGNLPFINQSGYFNFLPNYNNPNIIPSIPFYPTFLNMSQPKPSSPINKRKRNLNATNNMDDEITNKIAPILTGLYDSNSHADLSFFLNAQHDNDGHKLAQHARGTRKTGDNRRKRGNCRQCPNTIGGKRNARQTSYYCIQCGVSLHPDCFHLFHSKRLQQSDNETLKADNETVKSDHETVESTKNNVSATELNLQNSSETIKEQIATNDPVATTNDSVATTNDPVATN